MDDYVDHHMKPSRETEDGATDLISLYGSDLALVGIYSKRSMVFADMSAVCPMKEHNETDNRGRPDLPHLLF